MKLCLDAAPSQIHAQSRVKPRTNISAKRAYSFHEK